MSFADSYLGKLRQKVGSDLILYPGVRCVVLNEANELLLERRSDFGTWGLPGGGPEPGEDLIQTAIREVREEVGIRLDTVRVFGFASDPRFETIRYPSGDLCQYFVLLTVGHAKGQMPVVASSESLAVSWFPLTRVPDDMLPNMKRSIEAYLRYTASGDFQLI